MAEPPAISIENLAARFGPKAVFSGVSLRVNRGEIVALTGPSGSGKTTLLRCILGFVEPHRGSVCLFGESVSIASVWRLRRRIAAVHQEPDLGRGSVRDILDRPFAYRANAHLRSQLQRAPALFERFHLPGSLMDADIASLSGGEKQRVAIIGALLLDRPILLLDEPSSALDEASKRIVLDTLRDLNGAAVLAASHDPDWRAAASRTASLGSPGNGGMA